MSKRTDIIVVEKPRTAIKRYQEVEFSIWVPDSWGFVNKATLIACKHGDKEQQGYKMEFMEKENEKISKFSVKVAFKEIGIHYFYFEILLNGNKTILKYDYQNKIPVINEGDLWKITVYNEKFDTPQWAKGKLIYHIFVDRFCKSDNYVAPAISGRTQLYWGDMPEWKPNSDGDIKNEEFFMGNLLGIQEKLDYLTELGIGILYLSPICRSQSNHRYDTADYESIDPYAGNSEILKKLCGEAHKRGMYIILDSVFNHTGNDSKYYNQFYHYNTIGACQSEESPYYKFYRRDANGNQEFWWGFGNLPECNCSSKEWNDYICGPKGVIDKWFSWGIDGLRLDVADELTDQFIENIREAVHRNKKTGFIIGEVWDNAVQKEIYGRKRQYLLGDGLDSVMNYPVGNAILKYVRFGDVECFRGTIEGILEDYPKCSIDTLMTSLSTHDITRAITTLAGESINNYPYQWVWDVPESRKWQFEHELTSNEYLIGKKRLKLASIIQYFLPGDPCLYYGDEAGLYGYKDPFNRKCFPWGKEDTDLQKFFKMLGKVKNLVNEIYNLDFRIISITNKVLVFERSNSESSILIAINRSDTYISNIIPDNYKKEVKILLKMNCELDGINSYGAIIIAKDIEK